MDVLRSFAPLLLVGAKVHRPLAIDNYQKEPWSGVEDLGVVCAHGVYLVGSWLAASLLTSSAASFKKPLRQPGLAFDAAQRKSTMTTRAISARGLNSTSDPRTKS
jgi:hypothetical protein